MQSLQNIFAKALLSADAPLPPGLVDPHGRPAHKRFNVYRNNVIISLIASLEAGFPVILKLVGDEFFKAMANVFVRQHPPSSPLLMLYGQEFPEFLETFEHTQRFPYMADVARLEMAMRSSYHAADLPADRPAVSGQDLAEIAPEKLLEAHFTFAPSLRLMRSEWPIHSIWMANMRGAEPPVFKHENVLIVRPEYDPELYLLSDGATSILEALTAGRPLSEALDNNNDADLAELLPVLLQDKAIAEVHFNDKSSLTHK